MVKGSWSDSDLLKMTDSLANVESLDLILFKSIGKQVSKSGFIVLSNSLSLPTL